MTTHPEWTPMFSAPTLTDEQREHAIQLLTQKIEALGPDYAKALPVYIGSMRITFGASGVTVGDTELDVLQDILHEVLEGVRPGCCELDASEFKAGPVPLSREGFRMHMVEGACLDEGFWGISLQDVEMTGTKFMPNINTLTFKAADLEQAAAFFRHLADRMDYKRSRLTQTPKAGE